MKSKSIIVLEALLQGHSLIINNISYKLVDNKLYHEAHQINLRTNKETPILLKGQISLDNFIAECEKLTSDESFVISSNIALTKIKRGQK